MPCHTMHIYNAIPRMPCHTMHIYNALYTMPFRACHAIPCIYTTPFRVWAGLSTLTITLSTAVAYGFSTLVGLKLNPVVNVLPFILIGIGVDDMFVLKAALEAEPVSDASSVRILPVYTHPLMRTCAHAHMRTCTHMHASTRIHTCALVHAHVHTHVHAHVRIHSQVPERIARAMGKAGVSITITSLTDVFAFFLGTFSSLPALSSFCGFAAVGITADFLLQVHAHTCTCMHMHTWHTWHTRAYAHACMHAHAHP